MDNPAKLYKLTVFSQLLVELHIQTLDMEHKIIKAASEEDLRTMLLDRYPLKLNEMPTSRELLKIKKDIYTHDGTHNS